MRPLLLLVLVQGTPDDLTAARSERDAACIRLHTSLARWCLERELYDEAAAEFRRALAYAPLDGDLLAAVAEKRPDQEVEADLRPRRAEQARALARAWNDFAERAPDGEAAWARARARTLDGTNPDKYILLEACFPLDASTMSPKNRASEEARRAAGIFRRERAPALREIDRALGIVMDKDREIRIMLRDDAPPSPNATAQTRTRDGKTWINVWTASWTRRKNPDQLRRVVHHEMVHALQRLRMGPEAYMKVPKWFREGLAVLVAGQGPEKLRWALRESKDRIDPILDGLEPGSTAQENPPDYAEAWMALRFLLEKLGKRGFRGFLDEVFAGRPGVETAIKKRVPGFEAAAHAWARRNFRALEKHSPAPLPHP